MDYVTAYRELMCNTYIVVFFKRDGSIRTLLGTRNRQTMEISGLLNNRAVDGHDRRCSIDNGNIAVYDLIIDEPRAFNIGRLIAMYSLGVVTNKNELEEAVLQFTAFKEEYEKHLPKELTIETIDCKEKMDDIYKSII